MRCAECDKDFDGNDYLCWTCRNGDREIVKNPVRPPVYLGDLKGPEGNAWAVMGTCHKVWDQAQKDGEVDPQLPFLVIQKEMMSGSYEELLDTVEKYFTPYVAQAAPMRRANRLTDELRDNEE